MGGWKGPDVGLTPNAPFVCVGNCKKDIPTVKQSQNTAVSNQPGVPTGTGSEFLPFLPVVDAGKTFASNPAGYADGASGMTEYLASGGGYVPGGPTSYGTGDQRPSNLAGGGAIPTVPDYTNIASPAPGRVPVEEETVSLGEAAIISGVALKVIFFSALLALAGCAIGAKTRCGIHVPLVSVGFPCRY